MALNDAVKFINKIKTSSTLRTSLYRCDGPQDMENLIKSLGYKFTYNESEDAYRKILLDSANHDDAYEINEVFNMYRMLLGMAPLDFNA
jgi:hypothetical protein